MHSCPITQRFLEVYSHLSDHGLVKSARSFAMSIDIKPQTFHDILNDRRKVNLGMVARTVEVYHINAQYIFTGFGKLISDDINGISRRPLLDVNYLPVHKFEAYAASVLHQNLDEFDWDMWQLPQEMLVGQVGLAVQCDTDKLSQGVMRGDL